MVYNKKRLGTYKGGSYERFLETVKEKQRVALYRCLGVYITNDSDRPFSLYFKSICQYRKYWTIAGWDCISFHLDLIIL